MWQEILTAIVAIVIGGSLVGLAWWFKVGRMLEGRGAERFANDWHQQVIKRQDEEAARLRTEIQTLRDQRRQDQDIWRERMENIRREYTEFRARAELEFKVQRRSHQLAARDINKLANSGGRLIPENELETQIHITGMGPLDH